MMTVMRSMTIAVAMMNYMSITTKIPDSVSRVIWVLICSVSICVMDWANITHSCNRSLSNLLHGNVVVVTVDVNCAIGLGTTAQT